MFGAVQFLIVLIFSILYVRFVGSELLTQLVTCNLIVGGNVFVHNNTSPLLSMIGFTTYFTDCSITFMS